MYYKPLKNKEKIFAVAPMMDWTDRHCRYFHRVLTRRALLYTEMVVADAIIYGERERLLGFNPHEHPIALQLGGSDPAKLAMAARIAEQFGYDEVNLNVGCPSDRVQSGTFGACLMQSPELVAKCVTAMKEAVNIPVTVKCRIGVDHQNPEDVLPMFAKAVWESGCDALWVHARKAWLCGLSPKENREIPPLDYQIVYRLKAANPDKFIGINGGITSISEVKDHLPHTDGVMMGRAAYQTPGQLKQIDHEVFGDAADIISDGAILEQMSVYIDNHLQAGGKVNHVTRHMIGLFHGLPGARQYRRHLSENAHSEKADSKILREAFGFIKNLDQQAA